MVLWVWIVSQVLLEKSVQTWELGGYPTGEHVIRLPRERSARPGRMTVEETVCIHVVLENERRRADMH